MSAQKIEPASDQMVMDAILDLGARLKTAKSKPMTLTDVIGVAELMTNSLQPLLRRIDVTLQVELRGILQKIEQLRSDISKVHAQDISLNRIPEVGKELNEVVRATEGATNSIMGAAEKVLAAESLPDDEFRAVVTAEMMAIFEACSFQDITGQRVTKVVETVEVIEERINVLCDMMDSTLDGNQVVLTDRERSKQKQLLNGPTSGGADQSMIDEMF